ncbi:MAG TPA: hypothetical protein VHL78_02355 [Actinomycetota bacterium]|nr:hypothetical protein [Actinomycetota bacterium]
MTRVRPEPYHEPIGLSPEVHRISRRWVVAAVAAVISLAAGVLVLLRLGGFAG